MLLKMSMMFEVPVPTVFSQVPAFDTVPVPAIVRPEAVVPLSSLNVAPLSIFNIPVVPRLIVPPVHPITVLVPWSSGASASPEVRLKLLLAVIEAPPSTSVVPVPLSVLLLAVKVAAPVTVSVQVPPSVPPGLRQVRPPWLPDD